MDWFYLDWIRLENVLPAEYNPTWAPSPEAIGLRGSHESLLYVVSPGVSFPAGATNASLPLQHGQSITLTNWPVGQFYADWYDPATGTNVAKTQSTTTNNILSLPLPDFREDLAGIMYSPPVLCAVGLDAGNAFRFQLDSETGGRYQIENSTNLTDWTAFLSITNTSGNLLLSDPSSSSQPRNFFRARQAQ